MLPHHHKRRPHGHGRYYTAHRPSLRRHTQPHPHGHTAPRANGQRSLHHHLHPVTVSPHSNHIHHRSAGTPPNSRLAQHRYRAVSPPRQIGPAQAAPLFSTTATSPDSPERSTIGAQIHRQAASLSHRIVPFSLCREDKGWTITASMATDTVLQDQRKRTLEALERRFAVEHLLQQKKNKKSLKEGDKKVHNSTGSSFIASLADKTDAAVTPTLGASSKKGIFTFSGHPASQDPEENAPAYSQLSQPVHENLLATNIKLSSQEGHMVDKILHELLQNGDSAQKYMQGSRSKKIDNWILLDNFVQGRGVSTGSHIRALRIHSKRSKRHMSMKQHKKCGSYDLPQELHKFDIFRPMHEMWKGYMMQLLKTIGKNQWAQCLLNADLHGATILVAECKITSFTGVSGIMICETTETFGIITQDDVFQVVPKKISVFIFQVDCWKVTLLGDKLTSRNLGL